ncbi:MAG TPA: ABC transporter substrate-binding protein [Herpetosiphonaceae bacterium]
MPRVRNFAVLIIALLLAACGTPATTDSSSTGAATGATTAPQGGAAGKTYRVGIVQQTTHPALDDARRGVETALKESGLNIEIIAKNPQNDPATLATITDGFRDEKLDLVFTVGTQPAQAGFKSLQGSGIPMVFNTVVDPYKAGVAKSETDHPGVTGIQALPPVQQVFDMMLKMQPETKKVGNIWTSSEKNSEVVTGIAREYAKSKGIEFVERNVTKADEVLQAAESLAADKVDTILILTDSTVVSALESVVKVANDNDIGLYCGDPASAGRGCTAGLGLDYYDNGYISAKEQGIAILKGAKPEDLPIRKQEKQVIAINTAAAQEQDVTISEEVAKMATQTLDKITPKK